jgi:hypothetical protein
MNLLLTLLNKTTNKLNNIPIWNIWYEFHQPFPSVQFKSVTEKEMYEMNKSLKWKNACGYNEVRSKIAKLSMPFISSPLTYICNRMLSTGTFLTSILIGIMNLSLEYPSNYSLYLSWSLLYILQLSFVSCFNNFM